MLFRFLALSSVLVLASCGYAIETQTQDIRIETPGAENAVCYMFVDDLKYKVRPPQTMKVTKSRADLVVDCMAPGNRRQKVIIKPTASKFAYPEAPLILPLAWDLVSSSAFVYPSLVTVDFTYAQISPEALPAQNRPDVKQPEEYPLEEILPGSPVLNSDKYATPMEFKPREKPNSSVGGPVSPYMVDPDASGGSDKGNLQKAATPAGIQMNPSGAPSLMTSPEPEAGAAYPGQ